jgi:thymidylate synthase (FAD)
MTFETKRPTNPLAEEILNLYFPVFGGFIAIKDYMGSDESVEEAARVSYGAGTRKVSETKGLIRYLKRNYHSTPSEMIELKFHVCCPIFVMRQWIRHRASSFNEYSGRYSLMPMMFYTPAKENFAFQSKNNNQGRGQETDEAFYNETVEKWNKLREQNAELYENLTEADLARELARIDLPLSTYTQFYWKINLHNLFHFLKLRVDSHAQFEIQEYGKIIAGMVKRVAPLSFEAFVDYDVLGTHLSRMEMEVLKKYIHVGSNQQGDKYIGNRDDDITYSEDVRDDISAREFKELLNKFSQNNTVPNFDLDLTTAKDGKYFEELMLAAVPKIDKKVI